MIRTNYSKVKTTLKAAILVSVFLLFAAAPGFSQQAVNLTAGSATVTLPDGSVVPMWGYTCGAVVAGSTATCAPLAGSSSPAALGALGGFYVISGGSGYTSSPTVTITPASGNTPTTPASASAVVSGGVVVGIDVNSLGAGYTAAPSVAITGGGGSGAVVAAGLAWSPVQITVPFGATGGLQVNLTNNLSFASGTNIPTSMVILGQVGGGLGSTSQITSTTSPSHTDAQGCVSWFIANLPPGTPCTTSTPLGNPPVQGNRVQSMAAEVGAGAPGTATATSLTWGLLKPGTYLLESGTHPSIQVPMGLIGMLVVTNAPAGTTAGTAYPAATPTNAAAIPAVPYNAEVPLEFSEIDPVQNKEVDQAVRTSGFSETAVWTEMNTGSGTPCGTAHTCYPPAVNYTPLYYLINGLAFDKTHPASSLFAATAGTATTGITGNLLVRMVNAGLRMHVPSIVGSQTTGFNGAGGSTTVGGFTLIAEDGNPIPDMAAPRVQTDVFMAAGKTYDVMVNVPTATTALPVFDRELSLSANSSVRDAGMLAYIGVNGAGLPVAAGTGVFAGALANPDIYNSLVLSGGLTQPFTVSDPSKGVIANDVNVYGVALLTAPTSGTLTCPAAVSGTSNAGICANGTFAYTPNAGSTATSDTFTYCANNGFAGTGCPANLMATVTLGPSTLTGNPTAIAQAYTSQMTSYLKVASPGLLLGNSDPSSLTITVAVPTTSPAVNLVGATGTPTVIMDADGGFVLSIPGNTTAGTASFSYTVQNSQGRSATGTATVTLPQPSNLTVHVLDAQAYNNCNGNGACIAGLTPFSDYRWIIEEDKTFWVDPNCTTNSSVSTPGCPAVVGPSGQSTIPVFGVQFHTSNMDYVAQGCTGPLSCEAGQTMLDTRPGSPTNGQHIPAVCDVGNGACRPDPNCTKLPCYASGGTTPVTPGMVHLDPAKRYYISVLPGDAGNPFPSNLSAPACNGVEAVGGNTTCGHTMSGASIPPACNLLGGTNACTATSAYTQPVTVLTLPTPLPTGKLSVIVFEDDFPLNGEQDGGGGNGTVAPIEPGLGGFNLVLWDTYGGLGDVTGQDTYDEFNQPLSNSLAGTVDPITGEDACPVSANPLTVTTGAGASQTTSAGTIGITGMIVTCPKYEADGTTLSPLAGQAIIANLMPDKFSVQAYPGADRIARGEQWVQTNTLDGQHPHDSFIRIGEPSYFQEYGPAGYHVAIGFANPAIINARAKDVCAGAGTPGEVGPCTNTITGQVDVQRLSRTPDQRLYPSGSRDALTWTQCWVSLGDPDGEDFMFTFCDANGNFVFNNVPGGSWRLTIGDQWNDQIIDGLSTPANVGCTSTLPNSTTNPTTCPGGQTLALGLIGVQQWQSNIYTRTFIDDNRNGIPDPGEIGIPFVYAMIHYRDGHNANALTTDFNGVANFNETFPLFNWYVVEADSTRYKTTGIHTVYDAGGPADGSPACGTSTNGARPCGTSTAYNFLANTYEAVPLPADLSVPGAVYCAKADCSTEASSFAAGTAIHSSSTASTGRIDPPWVWAEGWSGMTSQGNWIEFGKAPYASCPPACVAVPNAVSNSVAGGTTASTTMVGENGGIVGQVDYASTRPFDDASQMIQQPWEPNVPNVTVNLYQEGFAPDGVTPTLTMVDTTKTSSWDDWAQGFYPNYADATSGTPLPYMSCPGQGTDVSGSPNQDLFFFTLFDQPNYLDYYNKLHSVAPGTTPPAPNALPYNSQYKCYDAMHVWNQLQPAPYDGKYFFPSSLGIDPTTGKPLSTIGSTNGVTASMSGTNCTICVANPTTATKPSNGDYTAYDPYRAGTPMLPPGKYVVEVIMPPGYEVYKEEDKNLLIGDNFIAPVTQQFSGLGGDIFILPDQASVASMYDESAAGYNPNNFQNETTATGLGDELSGVPGFPGFQDAVWPCVGEMRVVPDYLSLYPQALETAPFAGAVRPLCDRKEVVLPTQASSNARFFIYTSTHIASKYTGVITDDYTSEFDPFAPQFGEKFSPPNLAISTRDYLGNEISRVYSDHWGVYDGLTYSSWEVNPPNITGYSPTMMVQCMNDPGPIMDNNPTSPTFGQMIIDPLYNPAYSDFCYEQPFMPGLTLYADTPVVPTEAFVGAGYNNVDCSYPDTTPAVKEVDSQDGIGPWVSAPGHTLTITALGDTQVNNSAYSGPSANVAPFNLKTMTRHYGFGTQCTSPTATNTTCNTLSSVTIGGITASIGSWSDSQIVVTVPDNVPFCALQQQTQYGGSQAQCGELAITAGNGKQSIDAVTVTVGGKTPFHVNASKTIQSAIDQAAPGDLLIVDPTCTITTGTGATAATSVAPSCTTTGVNGKSVAAHSEMLLMWKPVRLQGVGAATSIIDANANPAGKLLDPWRRHVNCLFGLTLQGVPVGTTSATGTQAVYDSTGAYSCPDAGWNNFVGQTNVPQIDRLPLEAVVGWDATVNGNLAEQLQEPSLMGAYEGAGITVLAKGVWTSAGESPFTDGSEPGGFPADAELLQNVSGGVDDEGAPLPNQYTFCTTDATTGAAPGSGTELIPNPYPSNYECNPSSIDGMTIRDSSQGGGGIFVHGWAHNLQIANNRVYNNAGTLSGGITVGQGEFPIAITIVTQEGAAVGGPTGEFVADAPPSCQYSSILGFHLPYCLDLNVNVHNNYITSNSSLGDELFSGTLSGGGGATFCTGSDYYEFQYNWVCGNLSSAEGGGVAHMGFIYDGDIEHNTIAFNQSTNPTIPTNGGGIIVMGTPDTDPVCGTQIDQDCPPGLSDGTGPNLRINGNLIQGNTAESGSGGGIRLEQVNGTEVSTFPSQPELWNSVNITNNIIVNNVAGWDGAGISLQDSLNVNIVNDTIAHNDSLASSGVLTQSIGTPEASAPAGNCFKTGPTGPATASCPQSSGLTSTLNSSVLTTTFAGLTITCPPGHFTGAANNGTCTHVSYPAVYNDLIYQNRAFQIGITGGGTGTLNQQNLVALFNLNGAAAPAQTSAGACSSTDTFWDIGVRGDSGPTNHGSGYTITTHDTLVTTGAGGSNNPRFISSYCNGSRVPPECSVSDGCGGPSGYGVPPGIVDASTPNPRFSLNPSATVDEGNNWINVSWGPMSFSNDAIAGPDGNYGGGLPFGNYGLDPNSGAIDKIPVTETLPFGVTVPSVDFYGNPRPNPDGDGTIDYGAVETQAQAATTAATLASISPNSGFIGTSVNVTLTGTNLTGASAITVSGTGVTVSDIAVVSSTTVTATFTIASTAAVTARTVSVTASVGTTNTVAFTVTAPVPALTAINPNSGLKATAVSVTLTGSNLTGVHINPIAGITVTGVTINAAGTSITATFTIASGAAPGARNVTVANAAFTSNAETFTVLGPTLTSISPANGERGTTVALTLTGSDLLAATGVTMSGGGITCTLATPAPTATTVHASCAITQGAALTARNVTVDDPAGNATLTGVFQVTGAALTFSAPTPAMNSGGTTTKTGTITVSNGTGATAGTFTFTAAPTVAKASGAGNGTFSVTTGGTCTSTTVLSAGSSCTIVVQYAGETNTSTANGRVTVTGSGLAAATANSATFPAN